MTRTENFRQRRIVFALLIGVADEQGYGSAGGNALQHPGKDLHLISLFSSGGQSGLTGAAAVEFMLDKLRIHRQTGGDAIDDCAQCRTVGFTKGGDPENFSETAAAHNHTPRNCFT